MQDLIELEEQGWQALSGTAEASRSFYGRVLRDDATMLFPGGMLIEGKNAILESLATQPWEAYDIEAPRVIPLSRHAATLIYRVTAQRQDQPAYVALVSSTYARGDGEWKLVVHQQTPL